MCFFVFFFLASCRWILHEHKNCWTKEPFATDAGYADFCQATDIANFAAYSGREFIHKLFTNSPLVLNMLMKDCQHMETRRVTFLGLEPVAFFHRWLAWLPLVFVIATGCVSRPPSTVQIQRGCTLASCESDSADPANLKVATFNVWGLPSWINGASPHRYDKIAHELVELGPDVVLLQEVWTARSFEALSERAKGTARSWWTASARRKGGFLGQNGLLTLSKYPIEGGEFRRFSVARMPDSLMNKGALKVTITIWPGHRVNIWNVHLQEGAPGRVRSRQLAELTGWIKEAEDGQIADIVGGDFNFSPESGEFRQFAAAVGPSVHQLAKAMELPTWDGLKPTPGAGKVLDHIFVKLRQPADEIHAWPRRIFAESQREKRLSDHMGVEAFLTFSGVEENGPTVLALRTASSPLPPVAALIP